MKPCEWPTDVELRSVDAARKRARLYGMTACRTLFGELALVIAWGRIGHRLQRRTEMFLDELTLERRRHALLSRRRRHGYTLFSPRSEEVSP